VEERNCPLLGVCVCACARVFSLALPHDSEDSSVRALYLFQVKIRTTRFVSAKAGLVSCVGSFLGVFIFPVQLIAERTF
jgi:hypothetical protein